MKKLVVFDWNGTLLADTVPAWKAANVCLGVYGTAPITLKQFRETFHFPVIHFYKLNGCNVDDVLARKDEAYAAYHQSYESLAANCRLRGGAREVLQWLMDHNFDRTILSNHVTHKITPHLKRLKIDHYFGHVCGNDDGTKILQHTSKAERLSEYIVKRGYRPADIVIVGDSTEEPEIAHRLGLHCVSITDGYMSTHRLKAAKPGSIIKTMTDIIPVLEKLFA
jgi:phosphoglycolate phosphatase-like HAD superfamily hydrolase